jgi:ATP-dependent Clp protease ATP-binding subunit ClpA
MFERFSERARKAMELAQEEARGLQHNYIGTEHLLLGLIDEGGGVAARVLAKFSVEADRVRAGVEAVIGRGDQQVIGGVGLTPRTKKVIELATKQAKRLNHGYIGTEHLLLGLLEEGNGVAIGVLEGLGVELEAVRAETFTMLGDEAVQPRVRRYNLVLPDELYGELQGLAERQHTTVVDLVRRFVKLGLLATQVSETPGSALILREGERERELLLL